VIPRAIGTRVSSSLADPHRVGPFGGWHFGSTAGCALRGVVPSPETLRARRGAPARVAQRTTKIRSLTRTGRSARGSLSSPGVSFGQGSPRGESRRAQARSGLDGQTVIDRPGVSALGPSPIWQREVLLAHVLLTPPRQKRGSEGGRSGAAPMRMACFAWVALSGAALRDGLSESLVSKTL